MLNEYYQWLLNKIRAETFVGYDLLLAKLYSTLYEITRDVDQPRVRKVAELRNEFCDECFINYPSFGEIQNVSVLELLVSLASDAERVVMRDSEAGDRTSVWFWSMVHNLGLDIYTDDRFNLEAVDAILERFVEHKYEKNGQGSIAYTLKSRGDFRKLDVWQQLNIWLAENYVCKTF